MYDNYWFLVTHNNLYNIALTQVETLYRDKVEQLRGEKARMEAELEQISTEVEVLQMLNTDLRGKHEAAEDRWTRAQERMSSLQSERDALRQNLDTGEKDLVEKKDDLEVSKEKKESVEVKLNNIVKEAEGLKEANNEKMATLKEKRVSTKEEMTKVRKTSEIIIRELEREKLNPVTRNILNQLYKTLDSNSDDADSSQSKHDLINQTFASLSKKREEDSLKQSQISENEKESEKLQQNIEKLLKEEEGLKRMISDLDKATGPVSKIHEQKLNEKSEEILELQEKLRVLKQDTDELLVTKQGLDAEIKVYKTLIESQEGSSSSSSSFSSTSETSSSSTSSYSYSGTCICIHYFVQ